MEGNVVGRFGAVGAEVGDIERPEVVGRDRGAAQLDGFAQRVVDFVRHVGADDYRPAAEVDGRDIVGKTLKL